VSKTFPDVTEAEWRTLVARSLGGGRRLADLTAISDDGIAVGPIYGQRASGGIVAGRPPGRWSVVQRVDLPTMESAIAQIGADLGAGADAIDLVFATSPNAYGGGLAQPGEAELAPLVAALPRGKIVIRVDAGEATADIAGRILAIANRRADAIDLTPAFDPIAALAATGQFTRPYDTVAGEVSANAARLEQAGHPGLAAIADGRLWHTAGASEVQELAATVAAFVAYLRLFTERGIPLGGAACRIGVTLAADADQFLTIAKFRAARKLLGQVIASAGLPPTPIAIHAESAWRMMSRRSPHINILRTTVAAFGAGIGGADSIAVLPFDSPNGIPDAFARRLARNTHTILIEEAHLARVEDAGAGSGAIEALTDALAERAWAKFRSIEAAGGLLAVVRNGTLQREVGEMREARLQRIASHQTELVGASIYPDPGETPSSMVPTLAVQRPASHDAVESLIFSRLSEPFEG
jgi:methylmalonyl-CoA mutase